MSLGGGIILRHASCKRHEEITKAFERDCSSDLFGPFRAVRGLPSYNKKDRPSHLPLQVEEGGKRDTRFVPLSQYPDILPIPSFEQLPGIISGAPKAPPVTEMRVYHDKTDFQHRVKSFTNGNVSIIGKTHIDSYIRLTAKIAHGIAVADYGFNWEPLLLDIIEGDVRTSGYVIGAAHKSFEGTRVRNAHTLASEIVTAGDISFIVVAVGLFAGLGAPIHSVFAGAFPTDKPPSAPWRKTDSKTASAP